MFRASVPHLIIILSFVLFVPSMLWGITNPNISVIGQVIATRTDDPDSENTNTPALNLGESEIQFDAYLNPYVKGFFVFGIDDGVFETEEAYLSIVRGLPLNGLALKAGKYRLGFGKLNPAHSHAYPFTEMPRVIPAMLPGEEVPDQGFAEFRGHNT